MNFDREANPAFIAMASMVIIYLIILQGNCLIVDYTKDYRRNPALQLFCHLSF